MHCVSSFMLFTGGGVVGFANFVDGLACVRVCTCLSQCYIQTINAVGWVLWVLCLASGVLVM